MANVNGKLDLYLRDYLQPNDTGRAYESLALDAANGLRQGLHVFVWGSVSLVASAYVNGGEAPWHRVRDDRFVRTAAEAIA